MSPHGNHVQSHRYGRVLLFSCVWRQSHYGSTAWTATTNMPDILPCLPPNITLLHPILSLVDIVLNATFGNANMARRRVYMSNGGLFKNEASKCIFPYVWIQENIIKNIHVIYSWYNQMSLNATFTPRGHEEYESTFTPRGHEQYESTTKMVWCPALSIPCGIPRGNSSCNVLHILWYRGSKVQRSQKAGLDWGQEMHESVEAVR